MEVWIDFACCGDDFIVLRCHFRKFAAQASSGFAKNLRQDIYYKVQEFSFANIDKFSTASLVTRMTTDITNIQMAFQMIIRIAVRSRSCLSVRCLRLSKLMRSCH